MEKMNLQLFAGEMNTQTTGALSAEMKTYYGMELLENAKPQLVHNQFAATKGLPVGRNLYKNRFLKRGEIPVEEWKSSYFSDRENGQ